MIRFGSFAQRTVARYDRETKLVVAARVELATRIKDVSPVRGFSGLCSPPAVRLDSDRFPMSATIEGSTGSSFTHDQNGAPGQG